MLRRGRLTLLQFGTAATLHWLCSCTSGRTARSFCLPSSSPSIFRFHGFPSVGQHHLAFCGKFLFSADGGERGFCIAVRFAYGAEQPCGNQPQDIPLPGREGGKICVCHAFRRQQRMVVGDFAAIDDLLHMDGKRLLHGKRLARVRHQPRQGCRHIFRQKRLSVRG